MSNTTRYQLRPAKLRGNQQGLVAIIVTIILMAVVSLIVLTFATVSRREQRQTLDRQLATQALYAAESGVNDAINAIDTNQTIKDNLITDKYSNNCDQFKIDAGLSGELDPASGVEYTCVQVNSQPDNLRYDDIGEESKVVSMQLTSGSLSDFTIYWEGVDDGGDDTQDCSRSVADAGRFPPKAAWACDMGILRIDMVAINADGSIPQDGGSSRDHLVNKTATFFLSPTTSGSASLDYMSSRGLQNQGAIAAGSCSSSNPSGRACSVRITNLDGGERYLVRLKSLYRRSNVVIVPDAGNFKSAQAIVDVTGKANDVLKRVQVRIPLQTTSGLVPEHGIQTAETLCKRLNFSTSGLPSADPAVGCDFD